jgi:hypothetical protein
MTSTEASVAKLLITAADEKWNQCLNHGTKKSG